MATQEAIQTEGVMECQVCFDLFNNAIYQCQSGHVICQSCYTAIHLPRACPTCGLTYPPSSIRNRALEVVVTRAVALELVEGSYTSGTVGTPTTEEERGVKRPQIGQGGPANSQTSIVTHLGIYCDSPNCTARGSSEEPIKGVRYKCAECDNFDLCENCANAGIHEQHLLIRLTHPDQITGIQRQLEIWRSQNPTPAVLATTSPPPPGANGNGDSSSASSTSSASVWRDS